jgi:hypothetical protein
MPYTKQDLIMHFTVDSIHNVRTNAGSLEGPPPIESTMKGVEEDAKRYFYNEPFVIVPPTIKEIQIRHPLPDMRTLKLLPRWTHFAMYHGPTVKDDEAHGSILGIVWFDDEAQSPLADKDIILQVDWDKHARDFYY